MSRWTEQEQKVIDTISAVGNLPKNSITRDTRLWPDPNDPSIPCEFDSMDVLDVFTRIEESFKKADLKLPDSDAYQTVGELLDGIENILNPPGLADVQPSFVLENTDKTPVRLVEDISKKPPSPIY